MKILINTPDLSLPGGVANHYKGLLPYWAEEVKYNFVGGRKGIPGFLMLPYDYLKFYLLCCFGGYNVVLLNPSLGRTAIKRDAMFLKLAKWFGKKTVVFFHGWDKMIASQIDKSPRSFVKHFNRANGLLVLANSFKKQLQQWGITKPIYLTTTKVDDVLLRNFTIEDKVFNNTLLFLARIEANKGIFITIEVMKILSSQYPDLKLFIAGTGSALQKAKDQMEQLQLNNVHFLGNVSGDELVKTFTKSDIYILPTTHGEGMPTSVLEAMAFGLPVISRPVGGLNDFFEEQKMGDLIESIEPQEYANRISLLLENKERIVKMSKYNYKYAQEHFMASKVASEIESILKNI